MKTNIALTMIGVDYAEIVAELIVQTKTCEHAAQVTPKLFYDPKKNIGRRAKRLKMLKEENEIDLT